jgi:hypothetical protein
MAMTNRRFSASRLEALERARILGVRAGTRHRYTNVWVVVVERRVFVRSWNGDERGWFRAFLAEPRGRIRVGTREIAVRGIRTRSPRLRAAVTAAYAAKYGTRASLRWVRGFAAPAREATTLELVPR